MRIREIFEKSSFFFVLVKDRIAKVLPEDDLPVILDLEKHGWQVVTDSARSVESGFAFAAKHHHAYPAAPRHENPAYLTDTPAFKRWFARSKVVDRYGRPLRVYHGTYRDFLRFQYRDENAADVGAAGWGFNRIGFWFDANPQTPSYFAGGEQAARGQVMPVYLSIQNPLVLKAKPLSDMELTELRRRDAIWASRYAEMLEVLRSDADRFEKAEAERQESLARAAYTSYKNNLLELIDEPFARFRNEILPPLDTNADHKTKRAYTGIVADVQKSLIAQGYDGIHLVGTMADSGSRGHSPTDWWIAFRPNQIKSALGNRGGFTPDHDDITEGFDGAGKYCL